MGKHSSGAFPRAQPLAEMQTDGKQQWLDWWETSPSKTRGAEHLVHHLAAQLTELEPLGM